MVKMCRRRYILVNHKIEEIYQEGLEIVNSGLHHAF